jgi:hypothetical protein
MKMTIAGAVLLLLATVVQAEAPPSLLFEDVTEVAGITFQQRSAPEKKYILESMSGGVALLDFDNDNKLDIFLVNSLTVDTADQPASAPSALYRNLGNGRFEDVAKSAGIAEVGWGVGVCVADYDGDGWKDIYVTGVGSNRLYRNDGKGQFTDQANALGVEARGWSTGCGFADYDRDGDLDLFVSRYLDMGPDNLPEFGGDKNCQYRGIAVQCGPRGLPGDSDLLFRNDGDRFTEVGDKAGVRDAGGYFGMGVAWFDYDQDGWPDLFVANDAGPNFLYHNRGDGTFEEVGFPLGVAVSEDGGEQGGMGVAVGDYRNEGRFSLFVTNFSEEYNVLYHNEKEYFSDVSFRSGSAPSSLPYVGWGTAFFDWDNDGWLDLMAVNGHVYPQLDNVKLGGSASYRQRKLLYHGVGDGTFEEVAEDFGPLLMDKKVSRGLAVGDLDNDGRLDVVVNNLDGRAQVLRNAFQGAGNWLSIRLVGKGENRDAIGAVVTARSGDLAQSRLVRSGTSYLSQNDFRLHFGLGKVAKVDVIEVRWPDGSTTQRSAVAANQELVIEQP